MSKPSQIKKNIKLSTDLSNYLVSNPRTLTELPNDASFVVFSEDDKALNRVNGTIIDSMLNEGTIVVKAQETKKQREPWKFTPIFPQ